MSFPFKISVVIAVYNAEKYITKAVESALAEEEVGEVILIEDASPDNALEVCRQLAEKYENVKLFRHPDNKNHGAPASFNLGIQKAQCEYLAILGADDYFLPGRFKKDKELFLMDSSVDGVYNAIAPIALSDLGVLKVKNILNSMMTMNQIYSSDELFENFSPLGTGGSFSLNGLTLKKIALLKAGYMDTNLKLSQDTHFCIKLAAVCKLVPGILNKPVALYGVHDLNRSHDTSKIISNRPYLFYELYKWGKRKKIKESRVFLLWQRFYEFNNLVNKPDRTKQINILLNEFLKNPTLISSKFYCKQLPIVSRILP